MAILIPRHVGTFMEVMLIGMVAVVIASSCGGSSEEAKEAKFDENGRLTTSIGLSSLARAVLIQQDGKIVAAGFANNDGHFDFAVARYHPDGTLDTSFGNGGIVLTPFGVDVLSNSAAIDSEGRIVVAGAAYDTRDDGTYLARYNADGSLDASFGDGGKVVTSTALGKSMVLQEDGKIVVVGDSGADIIIMRYNVDGSPDTSFGTDGHATIAKGKETGPAVDVAIQPDGKIVVLGEVGDLYHGDDPILVRCLPDGSLDTAFGEKGIAITPRSERDVARADSWGLRLPDGTKPLILLRGGEVVEIQPDGKILVVGSISGESTDVLLLRYRPDGTLDTSFGVDGSVFTDIDGGPDWGRDLSVLPNGNIVVAGDGSDTFILARYLPDGSLDVTFGEAGKVSIPKSRRAMDSASAVAVKPDGTILIAGTEFGRGRGGSIVSDFALARYEVGPQPFATISNESSQ